MPGVSNLIAVCTQLSAPTQGEEAAVAGSQEDSCLHTLPTFILSPGEGLSKHRAGGNGVGELRHFSRVSSTGALARLCPCEQHTFIQDCTTPLQACSIGLAGPGCSALCPSPLNSSSLAPSGEPVFTSVRREPRVHRSLCLLQ